MFIQDFKKCVKNKKGFTLIELIVVIAIIAILAAVLIPRFAGFTDKANKSAAQQEAKTILTAVTSLVADDSSYTYATSDIAAGGKITLLAGTLNGSFVAGDTPTHSSTGVAFEYNDKGYTVIVTDGAISNTIHDANGDGTAD